MRKVICSGIIFIYCVILRITMGITPLFILCLFLSLTLNTLCFLISESGVYIIYGFWILAAWVQPEFLWFLPLLFFHAGLYFTKRLETNSGFHRFTRIIIIFLAACISILHHRPLLTLNTVPAYLFAILLSLCLVWLTSSYNKLYHQFIHTVDEHTEQQILLKEKNQALLAKQDAEVHAATLAERNRIAREIHDNVGHLLSRTLLMTGAIQTMNHTEELKLPLEQLEDSLNQAMTSIRENVHNLHDEAVNLENAAKQLVQAFQFCPVCLIYDIGYEPPVVIRYTFLAITKEALANIIKHSNATQGKIVMREHPGLYQLEISDNGTDIDSSFSYQAGIGLNNMQERISQLHGTLTFDTSNGFRIFITIPKEP